MIVTTFINHELSVQLEDAARALNEQLARCWTRC